MLFKEVIGQKELKQQLVHMASRNRLSHALLFLGKEGTGALPLATAFAQYILCDKVGINKPAPGPSLFDGPVAEAAVAAPSDACGICPSCIKAAQLIHPDIHFSYPVIPAKSGDKPVSTHYSTPWRDFFLKNPYGNSFDWLQHIGAENKQGNITAYECADINRKMSLKAFEGEYKVLIMWMPELLGKEGNKLLKLIEEPPPGTVFLFVAENEELILQTILSRVQLVKLPPLSKQDIEAGLSLRESVSVQKAEQIAAVAEGNYHEALQQLQHADDDWNALLREWLNCVVRSGPAAQMKWIDEVAKIGREKQKQFLKYFTHMLRQAIRMQVSGESFAEGSAHPAEFVEFAAKFNRICDVSQAAAIIAELDKATYYIERNANAKLLFHALTIRLIHIIKHNSLILIN